MSKSKIDLHQQVTNKLVAMMELGVKPWDCPFVKSGGLPTNLSTGKHYNGINTLLLWQSASEQQFMSKYWLTFKQVQSLGGHVQKGSKSTMLVYYDVFEKTNEEGQVEKIPFLKYFNVFNVEQTTLDTPEQHKPVANFELDETYQDLETAILSMGVKDIHYNSGSAFYRIASDDIHLPPKRLFYSLPEMTATLIHEACHATGHKDRLNRNIKNRFGTFEYAVEEMVAECASAFVSCELGLDANMHGHASYIDSWITHAKKDKRFLFKVMSEASKAANHLLDYVEKKSVTQVAA